MPQAVVEGGVWTVIDYLMNWETRLRAQSAPVQCELANAIVSRLIDTRALRLNTVIHVIVAIRYG